MNIDKMNAEFIFKTDHSLINDLNTLLYRAEEYLGYIKEADSWDSKEFQEEQEERKIQVNAYITDLHRLIDCLTCRNF